MSSLIRLVPIVALASSAPQLLLACAPAQPHTAASADAAGAAPATAKNPIVSHIFTADPSADVYDGRVYVFTSHDLDDQAGYDMTDYHVFSSDDMVNWQDHGVVLDAADIPWADRLYAPDSCTANGKYYLYFPNGGSSIGVAVSERPQGPYKDALGRALVDASTPGVAGVEWIFDPTCFVDDDGQAYLYFGGGPSGAGARVIRLGADMISLKDEAATTLTVPDYFEAPYLHKRQGKYYYSYSTGFKYHAAYIDYMTGDHPMGPFQYEGTVLASPEGNHDNNNHHSFVEYGDQWYIFYHSRVLANQRKKGIYQRSIAVDVVTYDPQGKLNTVPTRTGIVNQLKPVSSTGRIEAELMAAELGVETGAVVVGGERAGVMLTSLDEGDWVGVSRVDFGSGKSRFKARVASSSGATVEVHLDGCEGFRASGTLAGVCPVPSTGGEQVWKDIQCELPIASGVHDVCLRFRGSSGNLLNVDHYSFE